MDPGELTCRELTEFLSEYLAAELPSEQRERFESHLRHCRACSVYLATFEQAVRLGKAVCAPADGPIPEEVPEDLVRAILAARRGKP